MDAETVEQVEQTPDQTAARFDADVLVESNKPAPLPDADDITVEAGAEPPAIERNEKGQFTRPTNAEARKDPKAKIGQAIYDREEAQRRAEAAEKRATDAEARLAAQSKPAPTTAPVEAADPEPNPDDAAKYPEGQFDRKFLKDQARWEARQEFRLQQQTTAQKAAQAARIEEVAAVDRQFGERYAAAKAADPDFESKVDPRLLTTQRAGALSDPSQATFGNFLIEQVFQSEHPKELLLHLSDPDEVQRLATLPAVGPAAHQAAVIRELAKFEARLGAAPSASAPKPLVSQAKPPIRPNGSSPTVTDPLDNPDDLSFDEYYKLANARDRRAARG